MAYDPSLDTDDSAVPAAVRLFFRKRFLELAGLLTFAALIAVGVALATWSVDDPSLNHALDRAPGNWLGYPGAVVADELMQFFGLGVLPFIAIPMAWAVRFVGHRGIRRPLRALPAWLACALACSASLSALPPPQQWSLASGLGGNAGDVLHNLLLMILSLAITGFIAKMIAAAATTVAAIYFGLRAGGWGRREAVAKVGGIGEYGRDAMANAVGGVQHLFLSWRERRAQRRMAATQEDRGDILTRLAPRPPTPPRRKGSTDLRVEPQLSRPQRRILVPPAAPEESEDDTYYGEEEDAGAKPELTADTLFKKAGE